MLRFKCLHKIGPIFEVIAGILGKAKVLSTQVTSGGLYERPEDVVTLAVSDHDGHFRDVGSSSESLVKHLSARVPDSLVRGRAESFRLADLG